jgi:hypothetical protein
VLYVNGGHPPWGPIEYALHAARAAITLLLTPLAPARGAARRVASGLRWLGLAGGAPAGLRRIAHGSAAIMS